MQEIPYGFCQCGCGEKTIVSAVTCRPQNRYRGVPLRFIHGHHTRVMVRTWRSGRWKGGKFVELGYVKVWTPGHPRARRGYVNEANLIVEAAMGKFLLHPHMVHHVDGKKANNEPTNLVACENNDYHSLLHRRTKAYRECGHAKYRWCSFCKTYDDPANMLISSKDDRSAQYYHAECRKQYRRDFARQRGLTCQR